MKTSDYPDHGSGFAPVDHRAAVAAETARFVAVVKGADLATAVPELPRLDAGRPGQAHRAASSGGSRRCCGRASRSPRKSVRWTCGSRTRRADTPTGWPRVRPWPRKRSRPPTRTCRCGHGASTSTPASGPAGCSSRPCCTGPTPNGARPAAHDRPPVAVDGIDEFLVNLPFAAFFAPKVANLRGPDRTIRFRATDGDDDWLVRLRPDGFGLDTADPTRTPLPRPSGEPRPTCSSSHTVGCPTTRRSRSRGGRGPAGPLVRQLRLLRGHISLLRMPLESSSGSARDAEPDGAVLSVRPCRSVLSVRCRSVLPVGPRFGDGRRGAGPGPGTRSRCAAGPATDEAAGAWRVRHALATRGSPAVCGLRSAVCGLRSAAAPAGRPGCRFIRPAAARSPAVGGGRRPSRWLVRSVHVCRAPCVGRLPPSRRARRPTADGRRAAHRSGGPAGPSVNSARENERPRTSGHSRRIFGIDSGAGPAGPSGAPSWSRAESPRVCGEHHTPRRTYWSVWSPGIREQTGDDVSDQPPDPPGRPSPG